MARKSKKQRTVRLNYWVREYVEVTSDELLKFDKLAREKWELTNKDKLAVGEYLMQAEDAGLVTLPENSDDYHFGDDYVDGDDVVDMTREALEEFLGERSS